MTDGGLLGLGFRRRKAGSGVRRSSRRWVVGLALSFSIACVPLRGGWEVDRLAQVVPDWEALPTHRLGDAIPFPAVLDGRLVGVLCRAPTGRVAVRAASAPEVADWVAAASHALSSSQTAWRFDLASTASRPAVLSVDVTADRFGPGAGPAGVADTWMECDVAPEKATKAGAPPRVRGTIVRARIRVRTTMPRPTGRIEPVGDAAGVGALVHELGHAIGHAGHARTGESVMVLEQLHLRALGRRILAGESIEAPNLVALAAVPPGVVVVEPVLDPEAARAWEGARAALESLAAESALAGPIALAGDRDARLVWRAADGRELRVDFPGWGTRLRTGESVRITLPARRARR